MADPTQDAAVPARLQIAADESPERVLLSLAGELDIASAPLLESAVDAVDRPLVIDLAEVTFMDSTGLRALLLARQHAESGGQMLSLRPGPRQVQRVFELSGTIDRFQFED
jgi:anti-sigma B factor antagonist